jgi:hypothetical protein
MKLSIFSDLHLEYDSGYSFPTFQTPIFASVQAIFTTEDLRGALDG